jgi:anti-sigma regulatory factor (Ser/Thr protein kinase)
VTARALTRRLTLPGGRRDARVAREFTTGVLEDGGIAAPDAHDAVLVVSELVTNAALHGRGPVLLDVSVSEVSVVIAVSDAGQADPARQPPNHLAEDGRGLRIVDRLATDWRVEHEGDRKTVVVVLPR